MPPCGSRCRGFEPRRSPPVDAKALRLAPGFCRSCTASSPRRLDFVQERSNPPVGQPPSMRKRFDLLRGSVVQRGAGSARPARPLGLLLRVGGGGRRDDGGGLAPRAGPRLLVLLAF